MHFKKAYQIGEAALILKMEEKKQHYWPIMLYYFKKGKNSTKAHKKIFVAYREGAMTDQMCQKWLQSFLLQISHWSVLHSQVGQFRLTDQTEILTENNQHYVMWEIAEILKISTSSVENQLHQLSYANHFYVWAPHKWKKPS